MSKISASKLWYGGNCLYWARPEVVYPVQEAGEKAKLGSCFHEVAEGVSIEEALKWWPSVDTDDLLAHVEAWRPWWDGIKNQPEGWINEIAFAINARDLSVRQIDRPTREDHKYKTEEWEIPGCLDLVLVKDDKVLVGDYKTGGRGVQKKVEDFEEQMGFAAYAAAKFYKKDTAVAFINHVTPEGVKVDHKTYNKKQLRMIGQSLAWIPFAVEHAVPNPGDHCEYCPAKTVCPATMEIVSEIMPTTMAVAEPTGLAPITTQEEAAKLYSWVSRAAALAKQGDEMLREFAKANGGVDLGEKIWGEFEKNVDVIKTDEAAEILMKEFGSDHSNFIDRKVTKSGILRAVKRNGLTDSEALAEQDKIVELLRAGGAVVKVQKKEFSKRKKK